MTEERVKYLNNKSKKLKKQFQNVLKYFPPKLWR